MSELVIVDNKKIIAGIIIALALFAMGFGFGAYYAYNGANINAENFAMEYIKETCENRGYVWSLINLTDITMGGEK